MTRRTPNIDPSVADPKPPRPAALS